MKTSSRIAPNSTNHRKGQAFTLIELLVVIAIIAVLMGLLFPAGQSALDSAKKTTAKNQAVQIATAITAYETEYGKLPNFPTTNMAAGAVAMLCSSNDPVNNPRGLIFLDVMSWKKGKGGTNSVGFCDPFDSTKPSCVALDTNYANQITVPTNANGGMLTITKHVGVWSTPKVGKTNVLISSWD